MFARLVFEYDALFVIKEKGALRLNTKVNPIKAVLLKIVVLIFLFGGVAAGTEDSREKSEPRHGTDIVTIDISYELFVALASYQELSEAEKEGADIHREVIPILKSIIAKLRLERKKVEQLKQSVKNEPQLNQMLLRLDRHIDGFANELLYRQTVLQYESLMEEQKRILKSQ